MRLADILKKHQGVAPTIEEKEIKPPVVEPAEIAKQDGKQQEIRELYTAEKVYSELISVAKNIYTNIESSNIPFSSIITAIRKVIALLVAENDDLVAFCEYTTPESYLYSHVSNVCILSGLIGIAMNYNQTELEKLTLAALLHDIGMIGLLDIASKPEKISEEEFKEIRKHAYVSELLSNIELTAEQKHLTETIISQIHERIDGHGYPKGLSGENINIFARIIGIADVYEALTHKRPWRDRYLPHEALKKMIEIADSDFDTKIIKLFIDKISLYPPGSYLRLSTDEIARVVGVTYALPTRPKVKVIIDSNGNRSTDQQVIDLSKTTQIYIVEPVDETKLKLKDKKLSIELKARRWWVK